MDVSDEGKCALGFGGTPSSFANGREDWLASRDAGLLPVVQLAANQSRSSSLIEVFDRVWASTFFTMTAQ
jgi:hypothetical protein